MNYPGNFDHNQFDGNRYYSNNDFPERNTAFPDRSEVTAHNQLNSDTSTAQPYQKTDHNSGDGLSNKSAIGEVMQYLSEQQDLVNKVSSLTGRATHGHNDVVIECNAQGVIMSLSISEYVRSLPTVEICKLIQATHNSAQQLAQAKSKMLISENQDEETKKQLDQLHESMGLQQITKPELPRINQPINNRFDNGNQANDPDSIW